MSNWFPLGKEGASKTYSSQSVCEAEEGQACYEVTGKDTRYHVVENGEVVEDAVLKAAVLAADLLADSHAAAMNLKYLLQNYSPDGVHVQQSDLDSLIVKIDAYLGV